MNSINRRLFLQHSAAAAAGLGFASLFSGCSTTSKPTKTGRILGANDEIRIGIVGFRSQGGSHISSIQKLREKGEKVRIVALCDVDSEVLAKGVEGFKKQNQTVEGFTDVRKLLEQADIDAISMATPNHWHALATIWAVQAGKDVYVEKPVSHNVWEGRKMVEAARKYNRIVQTGTQCRSSFGIREAVAWVQAGNLGKIQIARGLCYKRRASIGKADGPQTPPPSVDYDLWCGPAPKEPLTRKQLHYDWHWVWPTGNGDLGNQGIHQMDIARWFLGENALSPRVVGIGGRFGYVDDGTTPNTFMIFHDYANAPLIFEVRGLTSGSESKDMDKFMGGSIAVVVHCEGGHVLVPDYNSAIAFDKQGKEIKRFAGSDSHHGNFLKAMRSRRHSDLNADILEGHLSSALCHTGNVSYQVGRLASSAETREAIKADRDAENTFQRMVEHLGNNGVNLNKDLPRLGAVLKMNPATEKFLGNAKASQLLTRNYRAPFIVPAKV